MLVINMYSTMRYDYRPATGVSDLEAVLNSMLQVHKSFNANNIIFSIVRLYRKRVLSNKICYCVCELLPFCAFSFVRYTQHYQL